VNWLLKTYLALSNKVTWKGVNIINTGYFDKILKSQTKAC
jgi:hypothetical protein